MSVPAPEHHGDWQYGIYLRGPAGERPELPVAREELERGIAEALALSGHARPADLGPGAPAEA